MRSIPLLLALALAIPASARADDEFTLYELLDPTTHKFAITFDVTVSQAGRDTYLNAVRQGSVASDERVIDRATGADLAWRLVRAADLPAGQLRGDVPGDAEFIQIDLARPVPDGGEARLRILKTYADAESYWAEGDRIVFERSLGIPANAIVLPAGYELVGSSVPVIVGTMDDGRVKVSVLNDRRDALGVRIEGRRRGGQQ